VKEKLKRFQNTIEYKHQMKDRIGVMLPTIGENEADSSVLLEGKKN